MLAKPSAAVFGSQNELTIRQAVVMLNVSRPFVLRLISAGELKAVKTLPSGQRIPLSEVERVKAEIAEATWHALDSLYNLTDPVRRQQYLTDPVVRRLRSV